MKTDLIRNIEASGREIEITVKAKSVSINPGHFTFTLAKAFVINEEYWIETAEYVSRGVPIIEMNICCSDGVAKFEMDARTWKSFDHFIDNSIAYNGNSFIFENEISGLTHLTILQLTEEKLFVVDITPDVDEGRVIDGDKLLDTFNRQFIIGEESDSEDKKSGDLKNNVEMMDRFTDKISDFYVPLDS